MRREDKERMDTLERLDPAFAKDMTLGVMNALTDGELLRLATGYAHAWRILTPSADGIADRYGLRKRPEDALRTLMGLNAYLSARKAVCRAGGSPERWRVLASAFPDFDDTELAELLTAVERVYWKEVKEANAPMKPDLSGLPELTCSNLTIQEDKIMAIKFFETKHFLNSHDLAQLSDEQIYAAISEKEAAIAKLEAINTKPKRLIAQIEEAKNDLAALIAHLDKE